MNKILVSEANYPYFKDAGYTDDQLEVIKPMPSGKKKVTHEKHYMRFQNMKRKRK